MNPQPIFTEQELAIIIEGLNQMILDDSPEEADDPIVTAYIKLTGRNPYSDD